MPNENTKLTPYRGWCWRGAELAIPEIAGYHPGERTLHLGEARARIDGEQDFPVLFRVYAHDAWTEPGDPTEVVFPADTEFVVRAFHSISAMRTCFFLEQVAGDDGDPKLEEAFGAWLPSVEGPLPKANPALEAAWAGPFARWDCGAVEGDAPRVGVVYECEDAVVFTMSFTGRDEATVRAVLDASGRYLELAGIAQGVQDEDLFQERRIMAHLLPELPGHIDAEQEMAYLMLVTGLEPEVIDAIRDGELKYCQSIGLAESDDDDMGDLGIRRILEDHGGHWNAVAGERSHVLCELLFDLPDPKHLRACVPSPAPYWTTVLSTAVPQEGALETVRIEGEHGEGQALITAFPAARDGACHLLRIGRVVPAALGCEARVEATTAAGAELCYFDIDHLHPWNERQEGQETPVALAAFASALGAAPGQASRNNLRRKLRETPSLGFEAGAELLDIPEPEEPPLSFSPGEDGDPDEYDFLGQVETLDELRAWDQTLYRLGLALRLKGEPFTLPVYVAEKALSGGYRPWPGDHVSGNLWLQGALPGGRGRTAILGTGEGLD